MDTNNINPSILHVTASENLDVSDDLQAVANKTILELINEEQENKEQEDSR